jgi:signal transduction histidine kinase
LDVKEDQLLIKVVTEVGRSMGAVRSATQALLNGADNEVEFRKELLRGMENELGELQHQLDNIAHYQSIQTGRVDLKYTQIEPADWLSDLSSCWRERARKDDIFLEEDIPADLPFVSGDLTRLSLALNNILRNAVENTPPGGKIFVSAGEKNGGIWISIDDTGRGIPEEQAERIFEPLYQVKRRSRFPKGLGLGLCVANGLITAHKGWMSMDSSQTGGSNFTIWLPI